MSLEQAMDILVSGTNPFRALSTSLRHLNALCNPCEENTFALLLQGHISHSW